MGCSLSALLYFGLQTYRAKLREIGVRGGLELRLEGVHVMGSPTTPLYTRKGLVV